MMGTNHLAEQEKKFLANDLENFYKNDDLNYAWRLCKIMEIISAASVCFIE